MWDWDSESVLMFPAADRTSPKKKRKKWRYDIFVSDFDRFRQRSLSLTPTCLFSGVPDDRRGGGENAEQSSTSPRAGTLWTRLTPSHPVSPSARWTLSVPPRAGNTLIPQQGAAHLLSLPTSSLLAPAKTFEVFEQQGNTFAFHLTCLRRPLKCIIAEQRRSPPTPLNHLPSKGTFSAANPSSGKRVWPAISLSLPPFTRPPYLPCTLSPLPALPLSWPVLLCVCVTPPPLPVSLAQLLGDSAVCEWRRHGANCWPSLRAKRFREMVGLAAPNDVAN